MGPGVRLLPAVLVLLACAPPAALAGLSVRVAPELIVPGTPLRITVSGQAPGTILSGTFLDSALVFMAAPDGRQVAFSGVDLDVPPGSHSLQVHARDAAGATTSRTVEVQVTAKDYPTEELKVAPKYVDPPAEVSERIARDAAALGALWSSPSRQALFDGATVRPLGDVPGRNFGRRRVFNGQPRSPHSGTDLSASTGTPVPAAARGRVVMAQDLYYSGNLVVLDHGGGVYTLYGHLSRMDVVEGAMVAAGQVIGQVGATGRVTGAHLHWGARVGEARVDPAVLLDLLATPAADPPQDRSSPRT